MYVCLCHAVTDSHIADAVREGARQLKDISVSLKVTTKCGRCKPCASECLQRERKKCQREGDISVSENTLNYAFS